MFYPWSHIRIDVAHRKILRRFEYATVLNVIKLSYLYAGVRYNATPNSASFFPSNERTNESPSLTLSLLSLSLWATQTHIKICINFYTFSFRPFWKVQFSLWPMCIKPIYGITYLCVFVCNVQCALALEETMPWFYACFYYYYVANNNNNMERCRRCHSRCCFCRLRHFHIICTALGGWR